MKFDSAEIKEKLEDEYLRISDVRKYIKMLVKQDVSNPEILQELLQKEEELSVLYKSKEINFRPLCSGLLGLGARPTLEKVDELKKQGITSIVTLLKESEKEVIELGYYVESKEIDWIWFPLAASKLLTDDEMKKTLIEVYAKLTIKLNNSEKIFIHCAAGVHRTGLFANGLLKYQNYAKPERLKLIKEMREVTAREAVKKHWQWSEQMVLNDSMFKENGGK